MRQASENPLPASEPGPITSSEAGVVVFDIGASGIRIAIRVGRSFLSVPLNQTGLVPASLITLRETEGNIDFPTLMERVGEDSLVAIGDQTEKPHLYLRNVLASLRAPLEAWWGPFGAVGAIVSGFATDLQRNLVQKAVRAAGWPTCSLVNKTTALAVHALRRNLPGHYLTMVLGYSSAEASVVRWEGKQLRALSYLSEPRISGRAWDRAVLRLALDMAAERRSRSLPTELYDRNDWLTMRAQMELVRHRLDTHRFVTWPLPTGLNDGTHVELTFSREQRDLHVGQMIELIAGLVERCCHDAGIERTKLQGCLISGGLLFERQVRDMLFKTFARVPVRISGDDAQVLGACQLLVQELKPDQQNVTEVIAGESSLRLQSAGALDLIEHPDSAKSFSEKVRSLITTGRRNEARVELLRLRQYIDGIELGIDSPVNVFPERHGAQSGVLPPVADRSSKQASVEADDGKTNTEKAGRRKYALAKDHIRKAEAALRDGRLEQAVRLSHSAYKQSSDGRIFRAMIEIHLRAASKRSPILETFEDDRRWLLCALSDDQTSERVQEALSERFLTHVSQLSEVGTPAAHSAAISTLVDLRQVLPLSGQVEEWLRLLKEAAPGTVKLTLAKRR